MSRELKNKKKAEGAGAKAKKGVQKAVSAVKNAAKKVVSAKKKAAPAKKKAAPAKKKAATAKKAVAKKAAPKKVAPVKKKAAPAKKKATPVKKAAPAKKKTAIQKAELPIRKSTFNKKITALLLEARNKILQEVSEKVRTESEEPKDVVGDIYDIASTERERELSFIFGDRDRAKLSEIEDALDRLKLDCYEECEECGEPIAQKRLLAMPFTRVCVECKSKHERRQKATGRYEEEAPAGVGILERSSADDDDF